MHPGRERNVMRWEVRHEQLRQQLAETNAALAALESARAPGSSAEPQEPSDREPAQRLEQLRHKRDDLLLRLQELGPFPGAKMG